MEDIGLKKLQIEAKLEVVRSYFYWNFNNGDYFMKVCKKITKKTSCVDLNDRFLETFHQ